MKSWLNLLNRMAQVPGSESYEDLKREFKETLREKEPKLSDEELEERAKTWLDRLAATASATKDEIIPDIVDTISKFFGQYLGKEGEKLGSLFLGEKYMWDRSPEEEKKFKDNLKAKEPDLSEEDLNLRWEQREGYRGSLLSGPRDVFLMNTENDDNFPIERQKTILNEYDKIERNIGRVLEDKIAEKFSGLIQEHPGLAKRFNSIFYYEYPVRDVETGVTSKRKEPVAAVSEAFRALTNWETQVGKPIRTEEVQAYTITLLDDEETEAIFNIKPELKEYFVKSPEGLVSYWATPEDAEEFLKYLKQVPEAEFEVEEEGKKSKKSVNIETKIKPDPETNELIGLGQFVPSYEHLPEEERTSYETYTPTPTGIGSPGKPPEKVTPSVLYHRKEKGKAVPIEHPESDYFGFEKARDVLEEEKRQEAAREERKKMGPLGLKKQYWKDLYDSGAISKEDEARIMADPELAEVKELVFGKSASMLPPPRKKKAVYDIILGDELLDPRYGKGSVTDISKLADGVIGVSFGPNVTIPHYPAERIAKPCLVDSEIVEFKCPMDLAVITAEACLGDMPSSPCSFLKFIEDKPHCTYIEEMNKMRGANAKKKAEAGVKDAMDKDKSAKIQAYLKVLTQEADFTEHRAWLKVESFAPIRLHAMVEKKGTKHVGEIVERNNDGSVLVNWKLEGAQTVNWENELVITRWAEDMGTISYVTETSDWRTLDVDTLKKLYIYAAENGLDFLNFGIGPDKTKVTLDEMHQYIMGKTPPPLEQ